MPVTYEQAQEAIKAAKGGAGGVKPSSEVKPTGVDQLFSKERVAASGGQTGQEYGYQPTQNIQPTTPESVYTNMPNSDKLTPTEHWLYGKLPGFSESTVGQALEKFGESWAGKALNVLDIFAEGLERTIGLGAQYTQVAGTEQETEFWGHIKEAWNAGTLTYDVTNLPTFKRDESGKITGLTIPTDLPGSAELNNARMKLISGMPLEEVKQEYYTSLGALQLRSQLYDTYGHIVLDPLNLVAGALKPVEKAHVLRNVTMATKFTDDAVDVVRTTIKAAEEAKDIGKLAEAARVATKVSDAANFQKIADLEKAGNVGELAKLAGELTDANKMTRWEKTVVALTGGDPFKYTAKEMERQWWNPFALTPASRAHEYLSMVTDNVGSYIISKFDDPEDIISSISRASKSATGSEFGHAFLTLEGRVAQGALAGFDINAQQLITTWRNTTEARTALQNVAQMALGAIDDAALDTVMNAITKGGGEMSAIAKMAGISADDLMAIGKALEKAPYHGTLFKASLMNDLYEHTGKMAVNLFGVKSRGMIEKMSLAMKSAESLAFLRTNPAFLARNFYNNELTMIARGIFSRIGADEVDGLLSKIGYIPGVFEPGRLRQGFSMIGETSKASEAMAKGVGEIHKALRGEGGWLDNITNKINDIKLGKLDMGDLAQRVEVSARARATTYGYTECYRNMLWKPGKGYSKAYDVISSGAKQWIETNKGSEFIDAIEHKIGSAWHENELDDILKSDNIRLNIKTVINDAMKKTGFDVEQSLPADFIPTIEKGLEEAMPKGRTAVSDFVNRTRQQLQQRLDDLNEIEIERVATETAAAIQLEGPKAIPKMASKFIDEFWDAHIAHAARMEDLSIIGDDAMRTAAWKSLRMESDNYFTRVFSRLKAGLKGVNKGAKSGDIQIPDNIFGEFKNWEKTIRDFHKTKSVEWDAFFEARLAGKTPPKSYADIVKELDAGYAKLITDEDTFLRNIDNMIAGTVSDPQMKQAFINTRSTIADARKLDKTGVAEFFKSVRGLSPAQREVEFKKFWSDRAQRWAALKNLENRSSAALAGDADELAWANSMTRQATEAGEQVAQKPSTTAAENAKRMSRELFGEDFLEHPLRKNILEAETKPIADRIDLYASVPGTELPPAVNKRLVELAQKRLDDLIAQGGDNTQIKALERVVTGKGLDTGKDVFTVKKELLDEMSKAPDADNIFGMVEETGQELGQKAGQAAKQVAPQTRNYVPDAESMGIYSFPAGAAEDSYYLHRGFQALDAIERSAIEAAEKAPLRATDLPEDVFKELQKYIKLTKGNLADARYTSMRYGQWKADTALLNYNRRYNYDTWVGTILPFEFWTTHSAGNWALNSLDRPAMLTTYLRMRKSLETMGAPEQKIPDRLKGHIRINLPFAPKWMGNFFTDPLRAALPFDQFLYPLEKWRTNQYSLDGQAERLVLAKLQNGEGDAAELQNALDTHEGNTWNLAIAEAEANNEDLKFDAWDFASLMSSPHAPLVWAKEWMEGTPENIGPFMPLTRMSRGVFTALGIEDFAFAPHNIEAKVRKSIGLPAYDKWDDYRVARMMSNMAYEGEISVFDMVDGLLKKEGTAYTMAVDRANKEFAVGAVAGGILGIPLKAYPIGEVGQRTLYDEFQKAYKAYDNGDVEALNKFFDEYPEYEARLMQYKDPEVMARDFIVDQLWNTYYDYSELNKKEIREQLGDEFQYAFINKDTRSYDSIDLNTLAVWLKLMGSDVPGTLGTKPTKPLELTPPELSWRVDVFNDTRNQNFPNWYETQSKYYDLTKGKARQKYLKEHPELTQYWDWRRDWMMNNPDTIQYLTDLTKEGEAEKWQYESTEEMEQAYANQPSLTWQEWQGALGSNLSNLVMDSIVGGEELSYAAENQLEYIADRMGISVERLMALVSQSLK